jgi:putative membrane protein
VVKVCRAIEAGSAQIEAAIAEAESRTCGEIVVVCAARAGDYARERGLISFSGSLLTFITASLLFQRGDGEAWGGSSSAMSLSESLGVLIFGYLLFTLLSRLLPWVAIGLAGKRRRMRAAELAAAQAFHDFNVSHTKASTGVLMFIAQAERTVVVLGDGPIAKLIPQEEWQSVRDCILKGIKESEPLGGVLSAISASADLLCRHFPIAEESEDELPNPPRIQ